MKKTSAMLNRQAGFTLVELAIVMVIIGLLLAAVLKGSEMIANAKVKSTIAQLNSYSAGVYSYLDRYGAYPGDDPNAAARLGASGSGNGDGDIDGNTCGTATEESCLAFEHMRLAGFISGDPNATTGSTIVLPNLSVGGQVRGIYSSNLTPAGGSTAISGMWIDVNNVEGELVNQIDQKIDDGRCDSGSMFTTNTSDCSSGLYAGTSRVGFVNKI